MKNKKNIIFISIISIILTVFSSISCLMYNYAKNQVEYTIEFSQNTKIKTIGINTSNIPLSRFKDNELDINDDGFLYSNVPGKKITLSASVIDNFYVCYDNESNLIETDKVIYRENQIQKIDNFEYTYLVNKAEIFKNSINGYIIPIAIIFSVIMFALVYYLYNYYAKIMDGKIKAYNMILALIDMFIIYMFNYYLLMLVLRKFVVIPIIALLIYNVYVIIKMKNKSVWYIYATFIVTVGISMIYVMAPTNVPDEASHFYRAYKDSLLVGNTDDGGFWRFPSAVIDFTFKFNRNLHSGANKIYAENYISEVFKTADYNVLSTGLTNYGNVKNAFFLAYLPSSIILFIGRHIGAPTLVLFLLCRLFDLILTSVLCYFALKITPRFKKVLLVVALFPIFIQQGMAINMDYLTNATILLLIAYIFYLIYDVEKVRAKEIGIFGLICLVLAVVKFGYFPIVLLAILIPSKKFKNRKIANCFKGLAFVFTLCISFMVNLGVTYNTNVAVSQEATNVYSIKYLFTNPIDSLIVLFGTAINRLDQDIFKSFFDCFGYSTIWNEPIFCIMLNFMYFLLLFCYDEEDENLKLLPRLFFIFSGLAIIGIVYVIAFAQWTEIGRNAVYGIQARYFVASSALLYIGCSSDKIKLKINEKEKFYTICISIAYIVAFTTIIMFFS
ncbi:MAG: DUF2142 domain-containing protein [Clostridia bacterium]